MKTAVINIKTDPVLKQRAGKLASALGLSLSQIIHISLLNFVSAGSITASLPEKMTPQLEQSLSQVEKELTRAKKGKQGFKNATEMDRFLDAL